MHGTGADQLDHIEQIQLVVTYEYIFCMCDHLFCLTCMYIIHTFQLTKAQNSILPCSMDSVPSSGLVVLVVHNDPEAVWLPTKLEIKQVTLCNAGYLFLYTKPLTTPTYAMPTLNGSTHA